MAFPKQSKRNTSRLDGQQLWDYALRCLAGRALTAAELRQRLSRRAAASGDVDAILARLKEYGVLDDQRFAELYAAARLENQGLGKQKVLRDLLGRRIASGIAARAVEKAYGGADETKLVENFLARKFRNVHLADYLADPKNLASAYRKLRYAGFDAGVCIRVLKSYSAQADDLETLEDGEESG